MNNKQYKKLEKHYNRLVKNKTIKTLNECLVYKLAIDKAFSLQGVVKTLKDKYEIVFDDWLKDHKFEQSNNGFHKNGIEYKVNEITWMYIQDVYNL